MSKTTASLSIAVAVFGFDANPETAPSKALHVLTSGKGLPRADLESRERFSDAALRSAADAGVDLSGAKRGAKPRLHLVGVDDAPGRNRNVAAWYYATAPYEPSKSTTWASVGRGSRFSAEDGDALKTALERLRADTRNVAGAVALIGDVFTGDDLLRLHVAVHDGPEGSERTFRRRVQELRDSGVLRPVRDNEVASLRLRFPRFRSPAGTGGRPPELLRYAGSGGEDEQLASLRARRVG